MENHAVLMDGRLSRVKVSILPKLIYKLIIVPIARKIFCKYRQDCSKFYIERD